MASTKAPPSTSSNPTRTYIRIRPTDTELDPQAVEDHFRKLHALRSTDQPTQWYRRLFDSQTPPTIEWLLTTDGTPHEPIDYYVGISEPDLLDGLERILRGLFPNTFEFERTPFSFDDLLSIGENEADEELSPITTVEFLGEAERRDDWQTHLGRPLNAHDDTIPRLPLATIIETMASNTTPMVYQALLQPYGTWSTISENRQVRLENGRDTPAQRFVDEWITDTGDGSTADPTAKQRIESIDARDPHHSFVVNARLLAITQSPETAPTSDLTTAFEGISGPYYRIRGVERTGKDAQQVQEAITDKTLHRPDYDRLTTKLPWTTNTSQAFVADPTEVAAFCLLDGSTLTAEGARALSPTPGERTSIPHPPFDQLEPYEEHGFTLGRPLTQDDTPIPESIAVPPSLQTLHQAILGQTGSGKSTLATNAILPNHLATRGADIIVEPKGGSMTLDYLRAHYLHYGHFDNVLYFDCSETLPAFTFFDIRGELESGIPRPKAVESRTKHYTELLAQLMGHEQFYQAVRSPDVIEYLVKALFDPVHGYDVYTQRDLQGTVRRMAERQSAPAVSDQDLEDSLEGVLSYRAQTFSDIMGGVASRIEKITTNAYLTRIFNHVADEGSPAFDLADYLDEDVVIIFDMGELSPRTRRALTLVILSNLWTALQRRTIRSDEIDHPLVNLYLEEAANLATSELLQTMLAEAREFDCSLTLSMQFPEQLGKENAHATYELLNNVGTYVVGAVPHDPRLAERLATDDMSPGQAANRLRALRRGQWLVKLPAPFSAPPPRPFLVESLALPPGHPAGSRPFTESEAEEFDAVQSVCEDRTRADCGITIELPSTPGQSESQDTDPVSEQPRIDSALAFTRRMPPTVEYDSSIHALRCNQCDNRYDPSIEGMKRAIECCSSLEDVDRDDVPICELNLKLTPGERADSEWSDRQLAFLQAVYNAQQLRYDPLEYDLLHDSMIRLQEYTGIDTEEVGELQEADLLRHDTDHPHRLYSVTPDGRQAIGESYRLGVDYGHGKGDLEESSEHVLAVEVARQYLEAEYVENPDSSVTKVVPYYEVREGSLPVAAFMGDGKDAEAAVEEFERHRLDCVGLDEEGDVIITVEAERVNHDVKHAVPEDYDKMAACEPDEAIWIVMTQSEGHEVLKALNDPLNGEPRVKKTYAKTTPPQQFRIDTPGMTAMYPVEYVRDVLLDESDE